MAIKEDDDKEDDDEVGFNESSVRDKRIEKLAHVNSSCVRDSKERRDYINLLHFHLFHFVVIFFRFHSVGCL